MKSTRMRRAAYRALWAFAFAITAVSVWGFWHALASLSPTLQQAAAVQQQLNRLESALVRMERCLLGLAHADSRKVRYVGYDPARLFADLRHAHHEADAAVHEILTALSSVHDLAFQQRLIRLELKWAQTRARLGEYEVSGKPEQINLPTLRTFSFRGQGALGEAIEEFKRAYREQVEHALQASLHALWSYAVGLGTGFLLIVGLMWHRWARPARRLRHLLSQLDSQSADAAPHGDEWEVVCQHLAFQARRLREVEIFMRDLAMGRTPEPIQPTDASDALARSSAWLMKRFEELRSERREAV
ncbi:MAG: hypothetical protein N2554_00600 [Fimbriimonadales bacterium]|nr:hypothetical protein [Fimbriimonadales bacterium]